MPKRPMIDNIYDTPFELTSQDKVIDEYYYKVYNDKWPVCDGHLLFVPTKNNVKYITLTLEAAMQFGDNLRNEGIIDAYHFGMNMGEAAGQTVMWPHVHFIPRHEGDVEGFPGSVRLAHTNGRGAKYYMEHPDFKEEYIKIHKDVVHIKNFK